MRPMAAIPESTRDSVTVRLLDHAEAHWPQIRVITRMAFGFHGPQALIALAMLTLGGLRPALPGR